MSAFFGIISNNFLQTSTISIFRLHKTQDLLYDSTKDFLELRFDHRTHERSWMSEKDRLLRELDLCKQQLNISREDVLNVSVDGVVQARREEEVKVKSASLMSVLSVFYVPTSFQSLLIN